MEVVECLCLRRMPSKDKRRAGDWRVETADGRQKQGTRAGAGGLGQEQGGKGRVRMVLSG